MSEWWTYGLSDFLMFSPEAYWRLVERHNAAGWPVQAVGALAGAGLLVLAWRQRPVAARTALVLLALAWACVAWAFHWQRYSEIFPAAGWVAGAWALQAAVLLASAAVPPAGQAAPRGVHRAGLACMAAALLYPLLAPLTGRSLAQAEVFGWMPEPTALATLGALLALAGLRAWQRIGLMVLPVTALAFGAATRWLIA